MYRRDGVVPTKSCIPFRPNYYAFGCYWYRIVPGTVYGRVYHTPLGRCHPYARKSASRATLRRMQLTLHATRRTPHGASCLVLAMSAWSVKTRRAPSRHRRDARVYGHTTTAMHENGYPPPFPPIPVSPPSPAHLFPRNAHGAHGLL